MEVRTILYGYAKQQFTYYVVAEEAEIVKRIFDEYLSGKTLLQIGNDLTQEGVVYYKDKTVWTKQAIRRIMENPHYVGDEQYPAIIDGDTYQKANALRLDKGGEREKDSPEIHYLKYHTVCSRCGSRISRWSHYSSNGEAWVCVNGCKPGRRIQDSTLRGEILAVVNGVIENPTLLKRHHRPLERYHPTVKVQRDEHTMGELLKKDSITFQNAKKLYFDLLSEKFDCCSAEGNPALEDALLAYVEQLDPIEEIKPELFEVILKEILVDEKGGISVRFIHDAVLKITEGAVTNGTDTN